jgi:nicotinate phosphoribosyltransferase
MVYDIDKNPVAEEIIVDPTDELRRKKLKGLEYEIMLQPLCKKGKVVLAAADKDALAARDRAKASLARLDETQLRVLNPHTYPVGLELGLHARRQDLVRRLRRQDIYEDLAVKDAN